MKYTGSQVSYWWAVLLDAETQSEIEDKRGDGEAALRNLRVGNIARYKLRDECGLNLDEICEKARAEYHKLYQQELDREKAKEAKDREMETKIAELEARLNLKDNQ